MVYDELVRLKEEVASLRKCVRKIAMVSAEALERMSIRIPLNNNHFSLFPQLTPWTPTRLNGKMRWRENTT